MMETRHRSNARFLQTVDSVAQWLRHGAPGAWAYYHDGMLMADREIRYGPGQPRQIVAARINAVAREIFEAHDRGEVLLVQERLGPGQFRYFAVRTRRTEKKVRNIPAAARGSGRFIRSMELA